MIKQNLFWLSFFFISTDVYQVVKNRYAGNIGKERLKFCKAFNTFSIYAHDIYKSSPQEDTLATSSANKKSLFKPNVATEGPKKLKAKGKKENTDIIEHQESEGKKIVNKSKKDKQIKEEVIFENDNEVLFGEDLEKDKD